MSRRDWLAMMYDNPMDVVASTIRAGVKAPPGKKLVVCDLGSIESRVLGWMAGCKRINDIFAQGLDTYKDFATDLYQIPYDAVTKEQRTFCKPPVLGCGYRLGAAGLVKYAAKYNVEMTGKEAAKAVRTFRQAYWEVEDMWHWFDEAAKACVTHGTYGTQATGHKVTLWRDDQFMHIRLPSGRDLHYYQPLVEPRTLTVVDPETGEERKWKTMAVTYMGMDTYTHQWKRISTHGGKLVENIDQAISRDILAGV